MIAGTWHPLNTSNAAAQLPSDILVMIPSFLRRKGRDMFSISQVCRRWRAILVSSPLLWGQIDCRDLTRTIISLERHRSLPLQLELDDSLSTEALNVVLDHESKISSVSARLPADQLRSFHRRLAIPSVETLVLFVNDSVAHSAITIHGDFMFLRRLSVSGFLEIGRAHV